MYNIQDCSRIEMSIPGALNQGRFQLTFRAMEHYGISHASATSYILSPTRDWDMLKIAAK